MDFWDWVVSIGITGAVFTGALFMWLGRRRNKTKEDEYEAMYKSPGSGGCRKAE